MAPARASLTIACTLRSSRRAMVSRRRPSRASDASVATTSSAVRESSTRLAAGRGTQIRNARARGERGVLGDERRGGILHEEQSLAGTRRARAAPAPPPRTRLSRTSGASSPHTPDDSSIASSCSRTTPNGRTTSGAWWLFASSRAAVSSAPHRATQRATSQRGCENFSASAAIGSAGTSGARLSRSRSRRRSTALASLLAPMPWRCLASSTVCPIAAYGGTLPMWNSWYAPRRSRSIRSGSRRASPPRTRSPMTASSQLRPRKHAVDELLRPAAVTRVESGGAAVERGVEEDPRTQVGKRLGRRDSGVGYRRRGWR